MVLPKELSRDEVLPHKAEFENMQSCMNVKCKAKGSLNVMVYMNSLTSTLLVKGLEKVANEVFIIMLQSAM
jgi:hypothetical protein